MTNLADLAELPAIQVFDGIRVRRVQGELLTLAVVELDPNAIVPEHRHPNEQHGMVISGQMDFRIGSERRTVGPGGTWRILADVEHWAQAGPQGAVVIDVFAPIRSDWDALPTLGSATPAWPPRLTVRRMLRRWRCPSPSPSSTCTPSSRSPPARARPPSMRPGALSSSGTIPTLPSTRPKIGSAA